MAVDPHAAAITPHNTQDEFNELDPHGFEKGHGQHASHAIVGPFTLRTVLAFLLFFTALTVGLAQLEIWIADFFDIALPWWVNIVVAMSIATVKSLMVMAYFMQLKYDNPMNTIVMAFTFFALFLFIFFTGIDLFNRDRIYEYKAGPVIAGGTGGLKAGNFDIPNNVPAVQAARERWLAKWGEEKFNALKAENSHGHGHEDDHADAPEMTLPNANRAFRRPGHDGHTHGGTGHGDHEQGKGEPGGVEQTTDSPTRTPAGNTGSHESDTARPGPERGGH